MGLTSTQPRSKQPETAGSVTKEELEAQEVARQGNRAPPKQRKGTEKALTKEVVKSTKRAEAATGQTTPKRGQLKTRRTAVRVNGRREAGLSDDEVDTLDPKTRELADVKPITKAERTKTWTDEEALKTVRHIASVWDSFKLKKASVYKHISNVVLLGSKDPKQVGNFWTNSWKKFKACRRRENHTGGGDGDELELDETREEGSSDEGSIASDDESKHTVKKQGSNDSAWSQFSTAQLDRFEESELYTIILDIAKDHPEVLKSEEFDSSRTLSDSDNDEPPSSKRRHADADADLARKTFEVISASIASFGNARAADLEIARRREVREEQAETDRRESQEMDRRMLKRRLELDEEAHHAMLDREAKRVELETRRIRLEERERRDREWTRVREMLTSSEDLLHEQARRLAQRLQAEEDLELQM